MQRTRRIEVIRYSRRVDPRADEPTTDIDELLAIARIHESTCDRDEAVSLVKPIFEDEPRQVLNYRELISNCK